MPRVHVLRDAVDVELMGEIVMKNNKKVFEVFSVFTSIFLESSLFCSCYIFGWRRCDNSGAWVAAAAAAAAQKDKRGEPLRIPKTLGVRGE